MSEILLSLAVLGGTGVIAALLLGAVSRFFAVKEDERVSAIEALLPGANCGGCGRSGCHDFAVACTRAATLDGLNCPGAGKSAMAAIAGIVGLAPVASVPMVAVLKCAGACGEHSRLAVYDGVRSCAVEAMAGAGEHSCPYGCLGCGDCVGVCAFGALSIDSETGIAVVDDSLCTGCGACVKACPRSVMELRPAGPRGMRIWVACSNRDKGAEAMKACSNACLGCGKCERACTHSAINVSGGLAYIDPKLCKLCRKCVDTCPTDVIHKINFPESRPRQ